MLDTKKSFPPIIYESVYHAKEQLDKRIKKTEYVRKMWLAVHLKRFSLTQVAQSHHLSTCAHSHLILPLHSYVVICSFTNSKSLHQGYYR